MARNCTNEIRQWAGTGQRRYSRLHADFSCAARSSASSQSGPLSTPCRDCRWRQARRERCSARPSCASSRLGSAASSSASSTARATPMRCAPSSASNPSLGHSGPRLSASSGLTCGLTSTRKARQCCTAAYIALATAAAYPLAAGASVLHTSAAPPWEGEATGSRPPPDGAAHERDTTCIQPASAGSVEDCSSSARSAGLCGATTTAGIASAPRQANSRKETAARLKEEGECWMAICQGPSSGDIWHSRKATDDVSFRPSSVSGCAGEPSGGISAGSRRGSAVTRNATAADSTSGLGSGARCRRSALWRPSSASQCVCSGASRPWLYALSTSAELSTCMPDGKRAGWCAGGPRWGAALGSSAVPSAPPSEPSSQEALHTHACITPCSCSRVAPA
mmetsp:Transcript_39025/g.98088  ORF Transcript_39025/g.98088 Transcript_39025/m.98088 type:complete len:394 (-) Transcript_39025:264-1445(-)